MAWEERLMAGFYPVDHDDLNHPVFGIDRRPFTKWEAYCWLLDHAAFDRQEATQRGKSVKIARGQLATSIGDLAKAWKWQKSAVLRFLIGLSEAGFIVYKPGKVAGTERGTVRGTADGTGVTVITFCKYCGSDAKSNVAGTERGTVSGTADGTVAESSPYMLSLKKEDKKERKSTQPSAESGRQPDLLGGQVVALPVDDVRLAFEAYQQIGRELGLSVPVDLTGDRRPRLRRALQERGGLAGWETALEMLRGAQWITSGRWKNFSIDDMLNPGKLTKLLEGRYNNVWGEGVQEHPVLQEAREYRERHPGDSFFNEISPTGTYKP
jgi:hypothetical protein